MSKTPKFNYEQWKEDYIESVGAVAAGNVDYYCRLLANDPEKGAGSSTLLAFLTSKGVPYGGRYNRGYAAVEALWSYLRGSEPDNFPMTEPAPTEPDDFVAGTESAEVIVEAELELPAGAKDGDVIEVGGEDVGDASVIFPSSKPKKSHKGHKKA